MKLNYFPFLLGSALLCGCVNSNQQAAQAFVNSQIRSEQNTSTQTSTIQTDTDFVVLNCRYPEIPASSVWTFKCLSSGQIVSMTLSTDISEEMMNDIFPDSSYDEKARYYLAYGQTINDEMIYTSEQWPEDDVIDYTWKFDDSTLTFHRSLTIDAASSNFSYSRYQDIIEAYGLNVLWDSSKNGFYFSETAVNQELFDSQGVCAEQNKHNYQKEYLTGFDIPENLKDQPAPSFDTSNIGDLFN